jgi:hypothetical protein
MDAIDMQDEPEFKSALEAWRASWGSALDRFLGLSANQRAEPTGSKNRRQEGTAMASGQAAWHPSTPRKTPEARRT